MKSYLIKITTIITFFIPIMAFNSCLWSQKKWDSLEDRKFYFSRFKYVYKGDNEYGALKFMQEFPAKKVMKELEKRYNIKIDTKDFDKFIASDDTKDIRIFRFIHKEGFTWDINWKGKEKEDKKEKGKKKQKKEKKAKDEKKIIKNAVEFYFVTRFDEELDTVEKSYRLILRSEKHVRKIYSGDVDDREDIYEDLSGKISKK